MEQRPLPPTSKGLVPGSMVADDWYEYINADRRWLEAEVARLYEELRKMRWFAVQVAERVGVTVEGSRDP